MDLERSTDRARALLHRAQPQMPRVLAARGKADAVVVDGEFDPLVGDGERDRGGSGMGVLDRVVQRLERKPVEMLLGRGCDVQALFLTLDGYPQAGA